MTRKTILEKKFINIFPVRFTLQKYNSNLAYAHLLKNAVFSNNIEQFWNTVFGVCFSSERNCPTAQKTC